MSASAATGQERAPSFPPHPPTAQGSPLARSSQACAGCWHPSRAASAAHSCSPWLSPTCRSADKGPLENLVATPTSWYQWPATSRKLAFKPVYAALEGHKEDQKDKKEFVDARSGHAWGHACTRRHQQKPGCVQHEQPSGGQVHLEEQQALGLPAHRHGNCASRNTTV
eukprot:1158515-Pelagomonas_calceolata.AAC.2